MTMKKTRAPGPVSRANDRERRDEAMQRFVGNMMLAQMWLDRLREHASALAAKDHDRCHVTYTEHEKFIYDSAEVALPDDLTKLNQAVERMNRDLGGWIGER